MGELTQEFGTGGAVMLSKRSPSARSMGRPLILGRAALDGHVPVPVEQGAQDPFGDGSSSSVERRSAEAGGIRSGPVRTVGRGVVGDGLVYQLRGQLGVAFLVGDAQRHR